MTIFKEEKKIMILFFTGTGNSAYIAGKISQTTGDRVVSMNDKIKAGDCRKVECDEKLVVVVPTYAWRILYCNVSSSES